MEILLIFGNFFLVKLIFERELRYQKESDWTESDCSARFSGIALLLAAVLGFGFFFLLSRDFGSVEPSDRLAFLLGILCLSVGLPAIAVSFIMAILSWKQGGEVPPKNTYTPVLSGIGFLTPILLLLFLWIRWKGR